MNPLITYEITLVHTLNFTSPPVFFLQIELINIIKLPSCSIHRFTCFSRSMDANLAIFFLYLLTSLSKIKVCNVHMCFPKLPSFSPSYSRPVNIYYFFCSHFSGSIFPQNTETMHATLPSIGTRPAFRHKSCKLIKHWPHTYPPSFKYSVASLFSPAAFPALGLSNDFFSRDMIFVHLDSLLHYRVFFPDLAVTSVLFSSCTSKTLHLHTQKQI